MINQPDDMLKAAIALAKAKYALLVTVYLPLLILSIGASLRQLKLKSRLPRRPLLSQPRFELKVLLARLLKRRRLRVLQSKVMHLLFLRLRKCITLVLVELSDACLSSKKLAKGLSKL